MAHESNTLRAQWGFPQHQKALRLFPKSNETSRRRVEFDEIPNPAGETRAPFFSPSGVDRGETSVLSNSLWVTCLSR